MKLIPLNMKKTFFLSLFSCLAGYLFSQKVSNKLVFEQGQVLQISMQVKSTIAQQAMGQAIDINVDANSTRSYKVTNATNDNSTLSHWMNRITFSFDGMGQKRNFDSNEEKDINGPFGKPVKEVLEKKYDIIIDTTGKTLMALPEKIELTAGDQRMALISGMLKDVFNQVQPPMKGEASFFKILPDSSAAKGQPWTVSYNKDGGKYDAAYSITDITDTTIVVDFATSYTTVTKAEIMGNETTTTMNNKSTGKIIIDKATGIMREKTENTESNGNTETAFGTLPVTAKTTSTITVRKAE